MTAHDIRELYAYDAWATQKVLAVAQGMDEAAYLLDRSTSHGGIHQTLVHLHAADRVWLDRWLQKESPALVRTDDVPGLSDLTGRVGAYSREVNVFLEDLTDAALAEPVAWKDLRGRTHEDILWYSMVHKVNHATYHRGQVVAMFRQAGVTPESTDLVRWRREILRGSAT